MKSVRIIAATAVAAAVLAPVAAASGHRDRDATPRVFTLKPDPAANPEGVASDGRAFYVSDTGSGSIFRGTLDSDTVSPFISVTGGSAVGLKVRDGKLFVAGGGTGKITVYDLSSKAVVASWDTGAGGFLNDLVVTRRGDVYVTDSTRPTLWHVRLGSSSVQALDISAGIPYVAGFNLNGIVAKHDRRLVVVQSNTGKLFRIDLKRDGDAIDDIDEISGVTVPGGDGMLLDRGRLIVVQGSPAQLSFVKLRDGALRGELDGTRTSPLLKGPSTIARDDHTYLVVNADFATSTKPFTVAGLPREDDRGNDDHGHDGPNHDAGDDHGGSGHGGHDRGGHGGSRPR